MALGLLASVAMGRQQPLPDPPQVSFRDLFVAVQTAPVFSDGKAFPDAVPKSAPDDILAQYHAARPTSAGDLERFVEEHFVLPAAATVVLSSPQHVSLEAHIDELWGQLTRSTAQVRPYDSLLPLPKPYVVPGGRFREIYYWDSYFTMLGLEESGRGDLAASMVADFAHLIDVYGHVPNGARTYYLSRSQPPFFFEMVALSSTADPGSGYSRYLPQLRLEYAFWMRGAAGLRPGRAVLRVVDMPDGSKLNRYWDDRDTPRDEAYRQDVELAGSSTRPAATLYRNIRAAAESGWDFSSRWFADSHSLSSIDTTDIVPIDLNSLLLGLEMAIQTGCERHADPVCAREFAAKAEQRRLAINRYLWNDSVAAFVDYRISRREKSAQITAATLYPLFIGVATPTQARRVARTVVMNLLKSGGLVTSTVVTGQQWDSPNGWAPLQWIAVAGLRRYHVDSLAETIGCRWMSNVAAYYQDSGKLVEKYDVVDPGRRGGGGEYPTQDGFGWTNGVMRKLEAMYPGDARKSAERCPPLSGS
jgi:alpha,alpha-trehalase